MRPRPVVLLAVLVTLLPLSGCGTDRSDTTADPGSPPVAQIEHPVGADDVVLRIQTDGGFTPTDDAFRGQPSLLVTGDGTVYRPADVKVDAIPAMLPLEVGRLDEERLQVLLGLARDADLLAAPPGYEVTTAPTDAPTTTVVVAADGETRTHAAYALRVEGETGDRATLARFVAEAEASLDDLELAPYEPARLRVLATPLGPVGDRRARAWEAPMRLDVGGCREVGPDDVPASLADTRLDTFWRQGGAVFSVAAAAVLPGDEVRCADFDS